MTSDPLTSGRWAMFSGDMATMRERLGLSKMALAEILGVSAATLYRWESYGAMDQLNDRNAEAVALFMEAGTRALDEYPDFAERFQTLAVTAQYMGLTQEWLLQLYRAGEIRLHDFDELGLFSERKKK